MRRLQPKLKERRNVPIPAELRDSLRETFELIQESKHDPDIRLDFDDAIQVGPVCGGRFGKKPRPYVLTYHPKGDADRGRWFLQFDHTEIEDIGNGRIAELTLYCCTSPACRCKFRAAGESCFYCDYADDPDYGSFVFPEAKGVLAQRGVVGVIETSTKDDVIAIVGLPDESGGGFKHPLVGEIQPWIKYNRSDCQLRFEFKRVSHCICKISILEKDWKPGK